MGIMIVIMKIIASLSRPFHWLAKQRFPWIAERSASSQSPDHPGITACHNSGSVINVQFNK
jgi:hypothetical protein